MENLTLEFVSGLVHGAYYASDLEIEDEKNFDFLVNETDKFFEVTTEFVEAYKETKFKGDYFNEPDPNDEVMGYNTLYFLKNERPFKIVKDFLDALERVAEMPLPELDLDL